MIKEEKCYCVVCDNCGEQYEDSNTGFSLWSDDCAAWESAEEEEWVRDDEKTYCPKCAHYDEDDNLIIKPLPEPQKK